MYPGGDAREHPDRPAFVFEPSGTVVTYGQLDEGANRLAHLYRAQGLRRGDHVAFFFTNEPGMLVAESAAERTGLYYTCINSYLSTDEVAYIVDDCQAKVVVASHKKAEVVADLPTRCHGVERWLMTGTATPPAGWEPYDEAVAGYPTTPIEDEQLGVAMLYSSGTTGRPKGILRALPESKPGDALPVMGFVGGIFQLRSDMVYLSPAPLYHSAPQGAIAGCIRLGATAIVMERFDPQLFLDLVAKHRVTRTQVVPTMFTRLLKLPDEVRAAADVSSLEAVVHAAAPCPVQVKERMIEWFGPIIYEYYAATEANGLTFVTSEEWLQHKGTVGRAVLGELVIRDEDGNECPTGVPGTVWFRGATSFSYWQAPEKTAESRHETEQGIESTVGDVGYVDEDGWLFLTDRKTHMIISGGVNIYPQETENLLITHPKVLDAAVIGVPNEDLGEEVKAVVQVAEGVVAGPELERELIAFCREHLAHFKCPRTVDFADELPRLPTGKLYKRLLRDRYWTGKASTIV